MSNSKSSACGLTRLDGLLAAIRADEAIPAVARAIFATLAREYERIDVEIAELDRQLLALHRENEVSQPLAAIPGAGPLGATLLSIKVTDAHGFKSGRDFAALLGLTPKNHATAGRNRLGGIKRAGDEMLRRVLVAGVAALIRWMRCTGKRAWHWLEALIDWKLMTSGQAYRPIGESPAAARP